MLGLNLGLNPLFWKRGNQLAHIEISTDISISGTNQEIDFTNPGFQEFSKTSGSR
jgi:hypothetical protein